MGRDEDYDDRDGDERKRRRPRPMDLDEDADEPSSLPPRRLVGVGGVLFCSSLRAANSAVQEAAAGAVFATFFLGMYVLVRCVEKFLLSAEQLRGK